MHSKVGANILHGFLRSIAASQAHTAKKAAATTGNAISQRSLTSLTGIDTSFIDKAPPWRPVEREIHSVNGTRRVLRNQASNEAFFVTDADAGHRCKVQAASSDSAIIPVDSIAVIDVVEHLEPECAGLSTIGRASHGRASLHGA
jgi:hypothetical protein